MSCTKKIRLVLCLLWIQLADTPLQNIPAAHSDHDPTIEQNKDGLRDESIIPQSISGLVLSPHPKCVDPQDQDRSVGLKDAQKTIIAKLEQNTSLLQSVAQRKANKEIAILDLIGFLRADPPDSFLRCMAEHLSSIHPREDGQFNSHKQHPSFNKWVYPQDTKMKHGNGSSILESVMIDNSGRDEFWNPVNIITLSVVDPPDQKIITAESGQDVTLTCRVSNNHNILAVNWSRVDLREEYVLLYQTGHFIPEEQHPSFKNRVDLQDSQMKDGDVSLILKNVTTADAGTYKCRVAQKSGEPMSLITTINLSVDSPVQRKTAESGQDITLPYQTPNNISVKWGKADLGKEYIYLNREGQHQPQEQHQSFQNRVDLQDRQMKDGDVSLILNNVTTNDTGTYQCCVLMEEKLLWISVYNITLSVVVPPGQTGGDTEDGFRIPCNCSF